MNGGASGDRESAEFHIVDGLTRHPGGGWVDPHHLFNGGSAQVGILRKDLPLIELLGK